MAVRVFRAHVPRRQIPARASALLINAAIVAAATTTPFVHGEGRTKSITIMVHFSYCGAKPLRVNSTEKGENTEQRVWVGVEPKTRTLLPLATEKSMDHIWSL